MQDRYVADVGDFGKYGLLRALAGVEPTDAHGHLRLGVVWYLTVPSAEEESKDDGKHTTYLKETAHNDRVYRSCDPPLYDALRVIYNAGHRAVHWVKAAGILPPETLFATDLLLAPPPEQPLAARRSARRGWAETAFEVVTDVQIVLADPDNGLPPASIGLAARDARKHAFADELARHVRDDQTLVLYHHLARHLGGEQQVACACGEIGRAFPGRPHVWALRFRRGTGRAFIIVPAAGHLETLRGRVSRLLAGPWGHHRHFTTTDPLFTKGLLASLSPPVARPARTRKPADRSCECGCGGLTKSRFVPGHDSRLRGWVLRVRRGVVPLSEIPDGERQAVEREIARKGAGPNEP